MITKQIFPIMFVVLAIGLFFTYIDPSYKNIKKIRIEDEKFNEALAKAKEVQEVKESLLSKYNAFSTEDLDKLNKLLPDHIDNVRLILDIDNIASTYGMRIKDVDVALEDKDRDVNIVGYDEDPLSTAKLSFSIIATYGDLKDFLLDLEKSLRIVDINEIELSQIEMSERDLALLKGENLYTYKISLVTYWLH